MQTIYLDISNKGVIPTIHAKQGDVGRKFQVVLTDSGLPYIPVVGSAFSVWYSGASGEGNYTEVGDKSAFSVSGNKVTVEMISQMLLNDGDGVLSLALNDPNGNQISTWNIPYVCEYVPGAGSQEAKAYYTAFSQAVENLPYPDASLSVSGKAADAAAVGAALKSKAPAGYGLGGDSTLTVTTLADLDLVTANGTYQFTNSSATLYEINCRWAILRVTNYDSAAVMQELFPTGSTTRLVRVRNANVWGEWEVDNPPMTLGVEYRTTERWNGKAVYTCLVNCGNVAGDGMTSTYHKLNIVQCISCEACATTGDSIPIRYVEVSDISVNAYANKTAVHIYASGGFSTSATIYAKLRYTKD